MNNYTNYFNYLKSRSFLGRLYRNYLLYPKLVRYLPGKTLDIGCGIGDMLAFKANIIGVDINPGTVDYCKNKGLEALLMEPDKLPFKNNSFDSVLLDNVLEHIENPSALLLEIGRVLTVNGTLLIGVPGNCGWLHDSDHKINYNEQTLENCLNKTGFSCKKIFYTPVGKSSFLNKKLRIYCMYGSFVLINPDL
jgi:SAM-dependent methyltransferase